MNNERFTSLVEEMRSASINTLLNKNANYASNDDRLHNFKVGASLIGGTPAQAALGYMAKHFASLQDKVLNNDFRDREDLLEKCQDIINYVVFIWCIGNEEMDKYTKGERPVTMSPEIPNDAYLRQKDSYEAYLKMLNGNASISCHGHGGNE